MPPAPLPVEFFAQDPVRVARELLGATFHCRGTAGIVVETEAYHQSEPSCHAYRGETPRTAPLFARAGHSYVYFTYGMHWCMNVSCGDEGEGAAVLLRALEPREGLDLMRERRSGKLRQPKDTDLCSGPAKLCQAMGIDGADNMVDLCLPSSPMMLSAGIDVSPADTAVGPRIGISEAQDLPWRFGISGSRFLSRPFT